MHIFQSDCIRNPKYLRVSGGICEFLMASSVEAFILARDSGQSHLPSSEFRFCDQYKKILASFMRDHTAFRHGIKLNRYEYNS